MLETKIFDIRSRSPCFASIDSVNKELAKVTTGCSVVVKGPLVQSQGGKQAIEVAATELRVVGDCPGDTYPLAKKRHSLEYLRTIAHLRPRTHRRRGIPL